MIKVLFSRAVESEYFIFSVIQLGDEAATSHLKYLNIILLFYILFIIFKVHSFRNQLGFHREAPVVLISDLIERISWS